MPENDGTERRYASPPCMAGEVAPDWFDPLGVDLRQADCRAEQAGVHAERAKLGIEARGVIDHALAGP